MKKMATKNERPLCLDHLGSIQILKKEIILRLLSRNIL